MSIIKYDRSGRSQGIAIISYETAAEAKKGLAHFNGKLCKGTSDCKEEMRDSPDSFPLDP